MASLRAALGQSASPLPAGPGCSRWTSLQLQGSRCCFEFARLHRPGQRAHPTVLLHLDCAGVAAARRAYPRIEATARHGSRTENAKVRNRRMQKKVCFRAPCLRVPLWASAPGQSELTRNRRLNWLQFSGTATKPRLSVFCSNKQLYAVLADDHNKKILFYGSTLQQSICGDPPCTTVVSRLLVRLKSAFRRAI